MQTQGESSGCGGLGDIFGQDAGSNSLGELWTYKEEWECDSEKVTPQNCCSEGFNGIVNKRS